MLLSKFLRDKRLPALILKVNQWRLGEVLVEPPAVVVDVVVGKGDADDSFLAFVAMIPATIGPTIAIATNTTMATATMIHLPFDLVLRAFRIGFHP